MIPFLIIGPRPPAIEALLSRCYYRSMLRILYEDESILAMEKPAGMHSAPLPRGGGPDLLSALRSERPGLTLASGRRPWEAGLLHRLDSDTSGLVLIALTEDAMQGLLRSQDEGAFIKEYAALCLRAEGGAAGARPERGQANRQGRIRSAFRAYGPRGARVAPIGPDLDPSSPVYESRVTSMLRRPDGGICLGLALSRGFRHQLRAHLSWIGLPIQGDPLYQPGWREGGRLMLHARALAFPHPADGRSMRIESRLPECFGDPRDYLGIAAGGLGETLPPSPMDW